MANSIKALTKLKGDEAEVKLLIKHPMDSGRVIKDGKMEHNPEKEKYITELKVIHNGSHVVFEMIPTAAISKDPFIKFDFKGAKAGDKITVEWKDNKGETDKAEFELK